MFKRIFVALFIGIMIPKNFIDANHPNFDDLSLKELTEFVQQNEHALQVAGKYFHKTYLKKFENHKDYFLANNTFNVSCFAPFMQNICVYSRDVQVFDKHDFLSIKELTLKSGTLLPTDSLKEVLKKVKTLKIHFCDFNGDFYESFLSNAYELERFYITDSNETNASTGERIIMGNSNEWLTYKYRKLNHFELISNRQFNDVINFLKQNSLIKTFSTTILFLLQNMEMMMASQSINLNALAIMHEGTRYPIDDSTYETYFRNLRTLRRQKFFKKLHLYFRTDVKIYSDRLLNSVALLHVADGRCENPIKLSQWKDVRKLYLYKRTTINEIDSPRDLKKIKHLEYIYCGKENVENLTALIRYVPNLKAIDLGIYYTRLYIVNLKELTKQRALGGHRSKITIYVMEPIYLATKLEFPEMKTKLIEIKRRDSNDNSFDFFWLFQ